MREAIVLPERRVPAPEPPTARPIGLAARRRAVDEELPGPPPHFPMAPVTPVGETSGLELLTASWESAKNRDSEDSGSSARRADAGAGRAGSGHAGRGRYRPSSSTSDWRIAQKSLGSQPSRSVFSASSSAPIRGPEGCPSGYLRAPWCSGGGFICREIGETQEVLQRLLEESLRSKRGFT